VTVATREQDGTAGVFWLNRSINRPKGMIGLMQSGLSSLNLDGSSGGLRFRLYGHHFGCTITGQCFEELRNGDNEDTKLDQDKMYSWRNEPHDMIRHSMARLDNKV